MLKDFIHQAGPLQRSRLDDWSATARVNALRRQARAVRRLRGAVGRQLIAIGERMVDEREAPKSLDPAA